MAKRALSLVVVLFFLTVTVFVLGKVGNADPVRTYVGVNASPEAIARARANWAWTSRSRSSSGTS